MDFLSNCLYTNTLHRFTNFNIFFSKSTFHQSAIIRSMKLACLENAMSNFHIGIADGPYSISVSAIFNFMISCKGPLFHCFEFAPSFGLLCVCWQARCLHELKALQNPIGSYHLLYLFVSFVSTLCTSWIDYNQDWN